ncbi:MULTISPECIES: glycosyltransferase family 2 protein [Lacticaseibacillus]|uniref:glycosyltransferase family 2 protein n=1 Tax=Lacticaseibacillus TaxID=2759736 RepID=UPI000699A779|nr:MULTISPECIES: glycosyltransferase family 2 protein [Lacticaseibacillus]
MFKHFSKLDSWALVLFLLIVIGGPILILFSISHSFLPFIHHFGFVIFLIVISSSTWVLLLTMYYVFMMLFGWGKARRDYPLVAPKSRFLILIPAHNEAAVITATLEHLQQLDYPQAAYHIAVVSDQSTDQTTALAAAQGVQVIDTSRQRYQRVGVGKPAGLQYALDELTDSGTLEQYDLVMVLDADNFTDPNLLRELDSQYQAKHFTAIQAYLDSKNDNTLLTLGYAMSYWTMNRFFQLSKYRLGLDNSIGGTGFVVERQWLEANHGFQSHSLTEDLEMEIRIVESGGTVGWNHFARIYDEKPDHLRASMTQRFRWSRGHWYTAFHNLVPLLHHFLKTGDLRDLDQLSYLFSMRQNFQYLLASFFGIAWVISLLMPSLGLHPIWLIDVDRSYFVPITLINWLILLEGFIPMIAGFLYDANWEGSKWLITPKAVLAFFWFSLTYLIVQIGGLLTFPNQKAWAHTQHVLTVTHHL